MKTYILLILSFFMIITSCSNETTTQNTNTESIQNLVQPERKLDIYGKITGIEGNEITILETDTSKDPTFNMTADEKKKYMQSMDESARMALKEEINKATLGEIKITVPVGIPIIKKIASGPDAPNTDASIADLKSGQYISIWLNLEITNQKIAEFVKIAFTQ